MRVFLTGGTGLLGSHVAEHLVSAGHAVRALVRPGSDARFLRELGAELRAGDVTDKGSLAGAMRECDGLVHAAAVVASGATWESYRRVNVDGTDNVLSAAAEQGVRRAVHVSSVAVYGGAEVVERAPVDEDDDLDAALAPGEHYARSKRAAEEVAWRLHRAGAIEVTALRPSVVYGERDRVVVPLLARYLRSPLVFLVGDGRRNLALVYAGNVAGGIVRALTSHNVAGRVYNLADDFPVTQREFFSALGQRLGLRPILVPFPYELASGAAWSLEQLARLAGSRRPPVSRRHIAFMGKGNPFVSRRARDELGWAPQIDHREGVRRAARWYLEKGRRLPTRRTYLRHGRAPR